MTKMMKMLPIMKPKMTMTMTPLSIMMLIMMTLKPTISNYVDIGDVDDDTAKLKLNVK